MSHYLHLLFKTIHWKADFVDVKKYQGLPINLLAPELFF